MKGHAIILWVAALMLLAGLTLFATAGPIRGLVDIGTGEEIPDADARYLRADTTNSTGWFTNLTVETDATGTTMVVNWQTMTNYVVGVASGLTTNDSPTMAAGTDWTFSLASITNDADTGTEIVNWRTLTNHVATAHDLAAVLAAGNNAGGQSITALLNLLMTGDLQVGTSAQIGTTLEVGTDATINDDLTVVDSILFGTGGANWTMGGGLASFSITSPGSSLTPLTLYSNGMVEVLGDATNGTEAVNYQTLTNYVTFSASLMTNIVSFPNGIYVAGTLIDGTTNAITVSQISDFADGVTNVIEAGNFTMDAGTAWTFSLLNVTNVADSDGEVVNWQAMTNFVSGSHDLQAVLTAGNTATLNGSTGSLLTASAAFEFEHISSTHRVVGPTATEPFHVYGATGESVIFGTSGWAIDAPAGNVRVREINSHDLIPQTLNTYDLGSALVPWLEGYVSFTADADDEIVNWQTMTNYAQGAGVPSLQQVTDVGNFTTGYVAIGTTDTSLLGLITTNDPVGPPGPYIATNMLVVNGNIVPGYDEASLGSEDNPWESLFVQNSSIYLIGTNNTNRLLVVDGDVVVETSEDGTTTTGRYYIVNNIFCPSSNIVVDATAAGTYIFYTTNSSQTLTASLGSITNAKNGDIMRFNLDGPGTGVVEYASTTQTISIANSGFTLQAIRCDNIEEWRIIQDSRSDLAVVNWGNIAGTLANQTDLQNALDAKVDILNGVATNLAMNGSTESVTASSGTDVVNWQTMTNQGYLTSAALSDVAFKSQYNVFSNSNKFEGVLYHGDASYIPPTVLFGSPTFTMPTNNYGSIQNVHMTGSGAGTVTMGSNSKGSHQRGTISGNGQMIMDGVNNGSEQIGYIAGTGSRWYMSTASHGSIQRGLSGGGGGHFIITNSPVSVMQLGYAEAGGTAINQNGDSSIQLFYLTSGETNRMTGNESLGMGATTVTHNRAIVAGDGQVSHGDETITAGEGFWTTNSPQSDNWVVNWQTMTNYFAITPALPPATNTTTIKFTQQILFNNDIRFDGNGIDMESGDINMGTGTLDMEGGSFIDSVNLVPEMNNAAVATQGNQIVSWKVMTNWVTASSGLTNVYTKAEVDALDLALSNALTTAYQNADAALSNTLTTGYQNADTALSNALTTAYIAADTALSNALTTAYTSADTALSNALTAAYTAADTAVSNALQAQIDLKVDILNGVATNLAMSGSTESVAATGTTMVVNWQTMTNYVQSAGVPSLASVMSVGATASTNLNMNGFSITGIANNSLAFQGGATIGNGYLTNAQWLVYSTATSGYEIVNWDVLTNYVATSTNNPFDQSVFGSTTNLTDGLSVQKQALYITNVAGTVYCETELIGGGDMTYMFGGSFYTLDCTTGGGIGGRARSGALTTGTDTNPVLNYVYVVAGSGSSAVLTNSTTIPSGEFAWMARAYLQSAGHTLTNGPTALQRTTEAVAHDGRSAIAYDRERIRQEPASYFSGVDFTVTDDAGGNVTWANTSGIVYQMHRQTFPSFSDPAEIVVINDPDTPYRTITNFNQITKIEDGTSIGNGRRFGVHIYGFAASGDDGVSRLYCTLPRGTYTADANALADSSNYDVNFLPQGLRGGGFSIARVVIQNAAGSYTLVSGGNQDFRGFAINATSGGGAGSGISQVAFQDTLFNIYDDADPTKLGFFDASLISTATSRTYKMPNTNGTLALLSDLNTIVQDEQATVFPMYSSTDAPSDIERDYWDCFEFIDTAERASWFAFEVPEGIDTNITHSIRFDARVGDPAGGAVTTAVWRLDIRLVADGELTTKSVDQSVTNVVLYGTTQNETTPLVFTNLTVEAGVLFQAELRRMTGDARDDYDGHIETVKDGVFRWKHEPQF